MMLDRWQNQEEALNFSLARPACMLDMDMGTGKTRVSIDNIFSRSDVGTVLILCPKSVLVDKVWETNLAKFAPKDVKWAVWNGSGKGTVAKKTEDMRKFVEDTYKHVSKLFLIMNYDSVWRKPMGNMLLHDMSFDMVVLDESHRVKAAGSKISKWVHRLGTRTKYKLCLSGTPMANSPLDVYGQYRFLDPSIFGTNYALFEQEYAIKGGAERKFVVGFKNQQKLHEKFRSIAYTCKMSDIKDQLKMPEVLPPMIKMVQLPNDSMKITRELNKEFIASCEDEFIVVGNVLTKMLRLQQITSGFCKTEDTMGNESMQDLNFAKGNMLAEILGDIAETENIVVFCLFGHDIECIKKVCADKKRKCFELSGSENTLDEWKKEDGAVLAVQIQAGAEGIDMTKAHTAVYFSLPHSLALYNQSKARLYRPGQKNPVLFIHLVAEDTIDESLYESLIRKEDIIDLIKRGEFNFGYIH